MSGTADQIVERIEEYQAMGMRAFIFSGYPHKKECEIFGQKVLPRLKTVTLAKELERVPNVVPNTPLGSVCESLNEACHIGVCRMYVSSLQYFTDQTVASNFILDLIS